MPDIRNAPPLVRVPAARAARPLKRTRAEREFLPAALEIFETPPSPTQVWLLWLICAMLASAIAWSWFAKLDIFASASGRVQYSGRSKVVQPQETGKVLKLLVQNGQSVSEGDLLIELDPIEALADVEARSSEFESAAAESVRRAAAVTAVENNRFETPVALYPPGTSPSIRSRENGALKADFAQLNASRQSIIASLAQNSASRAKFQSSVGRREQLIASLKERVAMREKLIPGGAGSRALVLDALQMLQNAETDLAIDRGQLLEAQAATSVLEQRLNQAVMEFLSQQATKLVEAERIRDRSAQELVKARARAERTRMTAPISGVVQQLAVTTIGQVVTGSQPLLTVVPKEGVLEIEAFVVNRDIGFLRPGQEAVIKVDAFPFTRYGSIEGKVVRVSGDAIEEREAAAAGDVSNIARGQAMQQVTGAPRTQNLVFPVTIELSRPYIEVDGVRTPLTAGMTATAEIRTGERRAIEFLLSPLAEATSTAGRER